MKIEHPALEPSLHRRGGVVGCTSGLGSPPLRRLARPCVIAAICLGTLLSAAGSLQAAAAPGSSTGSPRMTAVEREILRLENEWMAAMVKADITALDRLLADDYVGTTHEGTVWSKKMSLDAIKSGEDKITASSLSDVKIIVHGPAAIVTAVWTTTEHYKGKDFSGAYRVTDTWFRRGGRWQCVADHYSMIKEIK
jgi:ketosteroid isomerase-like protein